MRHLVRKMKTLSLQVCVNEASAQLCFMMPTLLTRRDELFPLARQIVRDSGYQYSKGHSRSQFTQGFPSKLFGQSNTTLISSTNGGAGGESERRSLPSDPIPHGACCLFVQFTSED